VTIYGSRSDIDDISSVACKVDISKLAGSTTISGIKLEMNGTISKMSVDSITISMTIEKE
jgi:YbbR domain-containing protein